MFFYVAPASSFWSKGRRGVKHRYQAETLIWHIREQTANLQKEKSFYHLIFRQKALKEPIMFLNVFHRIHPSTWVWPGVWETRQCRWRSACRSCRYSDNLWFFLNPKSQHWHLFVLSLYDFFVPPNLLDFFCSSLVDFKGPVCLS